MGPKQIDIITAAILQGDHIRIGTEDWPFDRAGQLAQTPELIAEAVEHSPRDGPPHRDAGPGQSRCWALASAKGRMS